MVFLFIKELRKQKNKPKSRWMDHTRGWNGKHPCKVEKIFKNHDYKNIKLFRDYNKDQRVIVAQK